MTPDDPDLAADDATMASRTRIGWLGLAVAILFGLLYAYDLFEAISNLFGVVAQLDEYNAAASDVGLNTVAVPWFLLIANIALAPVIYAVAFVVGRRQRVGLKALIFLAGLAVVAALTLSLTAFA